MINPQITLKSKTYSIDEIGNQIATETLVVVPIIRIETIYSNEFYNASQNHYKPELRIVISSYNYSNEDEFEFDGTDYSVIRREIKQDETTLIAERKIVNVG